MLGCFLYEGSSDSWLFNNNLKANTELLYELAYVDRNGEVLDIWMNIASIYTFDILILKEKEVSELLQASIGYNKKRVKALAKKMYNSFYKK